MKTLKGSEEGRHLWWFMSVGVRAQVIVALLTKGGGEITGSSGLICSATGEAWA